MCLLSAVRHVEILKRRLYRQYISEAVVKTCESLNVHQMAFTHVRDIIETVRVPWIALSNHMVHGMSNLIQNLRFDVDLPLLSFTAAAILHDIEKAGFFAES
jgi:hypothetical protein